MKKLIFLALAVLTGSLCVWAQPPGVEWSRVYGGTGFESEWAIIPTPGGRYLVAGESSSLEPNGDMWVILLDAAGDTIWTRDYGTPNYDVCTYAIATNDGGYALIGMRNWQSSSSYDSLIDGWLIKLDANGDSVWSRVISTPGGSDWAYWVEQTADGGYIVAGTTYSYYRPGQSWDAWLVKLDGGGDVQWQRTYGGPGDDETISLALAGDGGYALGGWTNSSGAGGYDGWLLKVNANGDSLWSQTYGGASDENFVTLSRNTDGGFLLVGYQWTSNSDYRWYLVRTDNTGAADWTQQYGYATGENAPWEGQQTADGGFIVGGYFQYPDSNGIDLVALKLDTNGDSTWSFRYGAEGIDYGWFACTTPDGGYIFGADTYSSWSHGSADWLLVKTQTECADPTPQAPQVVISTHNSNAYLNWDPVTQSVSGCPIFATHYLVFYSPTFAGPYYYHGYTTGTSYVHWGVIAYAPGQFYHVIASTAPLPTLLQIPPDGTRTEGEVRAFLTNQNQTTRPLVLNVSSSQSQEQSTTRRPERHLTRHLRHG
jgi:hypothetical protein